MGNLKVNWTVDRDVDGAVAGAVNGAVHDPRHPALQDFLGEVSSGAEAGVQ